MKPSSLCSALLCLASLLACSKNPERTNASETKAPTPSGAVDTTSANSPNDTEANARNPFPRVKADQLNDALSRYVERMLPAMEDIPADRQRQLRKLALFVQTKLRSKEPAHLTFICTHNSRRSHMSQLWAAAAAAYYGIEGVHTHSGGTEATAFNPRAVAAMRRAGFEIDNPEGENPHYQVSFAKQGKAQECFSKKYDDPFNPSTNFAAVMTCSQADKNCPTVEGATLRVPIPYIDPKVADGTPEEAVTYDERARQIAIEMFYLFSQVQT